MLDLGKGDEMQELNKELTGEVGLVSWESFNSEEDGRGGDNKGVQGVNSRDWKEGESDRL